MKIDCYSEFDPIEDTESGRLLVRFRLFFQLQRIRSD